MKCVFVVVSLSEVLVASVLQLPGDILSLIVFSSVASFYFDSPFFKKTKTKRKCWIMCMWSYSFHLPNISIQTFLCSVFFFLNFLPKQMLSVEMQIVASSSLGEQNMQKHSRHLILGPDNAHQKDTFVF